MRPRLTAEAGGMWAAEYSGWNLRAEGATETEAIDRLKDRYQEEKRRDPEAWRRRLEKLLHDPPSDWEVTEDADAAYEDRLDQMTRGSERDA